MAELQSTVLWHVPFAGDTLLQTTCKARVAGVGARVWICMHQRVRGQGDVRELKCMDRRREGVEVHGQGDVSELKCMEFGR